MRSGKGKVHVRTMLILLLLTTISCLFIYHNYILGDQLLVFTDTGSDTKEQYIAWYTNIAQMLRNGTMTGWDFQDGLGASAYNMNLFAPFLWIAYLVGRFFGPQHIPGAMVYILILEIILAGQSCYLMLSERPFQEQAKLFASYMYAFCGYLLVWGQHYSLGSVVVFMPLLIMCVEKSIRRYEALPGVALFSGVVLLNGYYQGYMVLLGTAIYVTLRVLVYEERPFKERLRRYIAIGLSMAGGLLIGAVNLLPSLAAVGESSRMSGSSSLLARIIRNLSLWTKEYYRTLLYRFFGINLQGAGNDFMGSGNYYEAASVFFSVLFIILLVQFVWTFPKRKGSVRQKAAIAAGVAIGLFMILVKAGSLPFNAFVYAFSRHTFLLMPFFAMIAADVLTQIFAEGYVSLPAVLISALVITAVYAKAYRNNGAPVYETNALVLCVGAWVMLAALLRFKRKRINLQQLIYVLGAALIVTNLSDASLTARYRITVNKSYSTYSDETYYGDTVNALNWISENDTSGYYRIEKDYTEAGEYLDSMIQQYSGVSTYNSMQTGSMLTFIKTLWPQLWTGYDRNHTNFRSAVHDETMAGLVGVKYLLSHSDDLTTNGYELVYQTGEVYVYRLALTDTAAHFFTDTLDTETFEESMNELDTRGLLSRVLLLDAEAASESGVDSDAASTVAGDQTNAKQPLSAYTKQELEDAVDEEQAAALGYTRQADGWTINGEGNASIPLNTKAVSAEDRVWAEFTVESDDSAYLYIYAGDDRPVTYLNSDEHTYSMEIPTDAEEIRIVTDAAEVYTIRSLRIYAGEETAFQNEEVSLQREGGSVLSGTVEAKTDGYVMVGIPYQTGWSLTVDGEKADIVTGDYTFIAFAVSAGSHSFTLSYSVPLYTISKRISGGSLALWLIWFTLAQLISFLRWLRSRIQDVRKQRALRKEERAAEKRAKKAEGGGRLFGIGRKKEKAGTESENLQPGTEGLSDEAGQSETAGPEPTRQLEAEESSETETLSKTEASKTAEPVAAQAFPEGAAEDKPDLTEEEKQSGPADNLVNAPEKEGPVDTSI